LFSGTKNDNFSIAFFYNGLFEYDVLAVVYRDSSVKHIDFIDPKSFCFDDLSSMKSTLKIKDFNCIWFRDPEYDDENLFMSLIIIQGNDEIKQPHPR
jgi:hypothetical protein